MADLVDWNLPSVSAHQREIGQPRWIEAILARAARHDGNVTDILANLGDQNAREEQLHLPARLGRRKADPRRRSRKPNIESAPRSGS